MYRHSTAPQMIGRCINTQTLVNVSEFSPLLVPNNSGKLLLIKKQLTAYFKNNEKYIEYYCPTADNIYVEHSLFLIMNGQPSTGGIRL